MRMEVSRIERHAARPDGNRYVRYVEQHLNRAGPVRRVRHALHNGGEHARNHALRKAEIRQPDQDEYIVDGQSSEDSRQPDLQQRRAESDRAIAGKLDWIGDRQPRERRNRLPPADGEDAIEK